MVGCPRDRDRPEELKREELVLTDERPRIGLRPHDVHAGDLWKESQEEGPPAELPPVEERVLHSEEEGRQVHDVLRAVLREEVEVDIVPRLDSSGGGRS